MMLTASKKLAWFILIGASSSIVQPTEAGMFDWLFYRRTVTYSPVVNTANVAPTNMAPGTCTTTCPRVVQRVVVRYAPRVTYRTQWTQVPVTVYRPVTTSNPATGCTSTCMKPCTTYTWQARRIPVTSYVPQYHTVSIPTTVTTVSNNCNTCTVPAAGVTQSAIPSVTTPTTPYYPTAPTAPAVPGRPTVTYPSQPAYPSQDGAAAGTRPNLAPTQPGTNGGSNTAPSGAGGTGGAGSGAGNGGAAAGAGQGMATVPWQPSSPSSILRKAPATPPASAPLRAVPDLEKDKRLLNPPSLMGPRTAHRQLRVQQAKWAPVEWETPARLINHQPSVANEHGSAKSTQHDSTGWKTVE